MEYNAIQIWNYISSPYVAKILLLTSKKPMSARGLEKHHIPIAECYRKIKRLEELGFLKCDEVKKAKDGKRTKLYKSQIENAYFFLQKGKFRARINLSDGEVRDFGGEFTLKDLQNQEQVSLDKD